MGEQPEEDYATPGSHLIIDAQIGAEGSMDTPRILTRQGYTVTYGCDIGDRGKGRNEDRVVIDPEHHAYGVIDGMGGGSRGDRAAGILAEELLGDWKRTPAVGTSIAARVTQRMCQEKIQGRDDGAVFLSVKIEGRVLKISRAGDVRLLVIGNDGKIKFRTKDQGRWNMLSNAIGPGMPNRLDSLEYQSLEKGYRVIIASDGILDNCYPDMTYGGAIEKFGYYSEEGAAEAAQQANENLVRFVIGNPSDQAMRAVAEHVRGEMQKDGGKKDNVSMIIIDITE